jgi:S1-C subfamily serine protease
MSSRVVSMRIITTSGDELPAKVVLRDKDRDLAFVRPVQRPNIPLVGVDFTRGGKTRIGDPVYILGRLGRAGNRNVVMTAERVVSVIERPRLLYVIQHNDYAALGNLIFNEQGRPLGMLSLKFRSGRTGATSSEDYLPVVIPAADVWEVARQAPQAKEVRDTPAVSPRQPAKPSGSRTAPTRPAPPSRKQASKGQPGKKP